MIESRIFSGLDMDSDPSMLPRTHVRGASGGYKSGAEVLGRSLGVKSAEHVMNHTAELGDPIGAPVPNWTPPARPARVISEGRYCRLEPLVPDHAGALFQAHSTDTDGRMWTYMFNGPFASEAAYRGWVEEAAVSEDPLHYTILAEGRPLGTASYLRIEPGAGAIEVGNIAYSPLLQRTRAATEAMFLMMQWVFEAGYRRYEWKCNALNRPSRRAAQRLGFSFEGVFRQAAVIKGRNRDTVWYAMIDAEWPALKAAFETWLDPANFDAKGRQKQSLSDLTEPVLVAKG